MHPSPILLNYLISLTRMHPSREQQAGTRTHPRMHPSAKTLDLFFLLISTHPRMHPSPGQQAGTRTRTRMHPSSGQQAGSAEDNNAF